MEGLEIIREALMENGVQPFYYQPRNYYESKDKESSLEKMFLANCDLHQKELLSADDSFWNVMPAPLAVAQPYNMMDLVKMTNDFSVGNRIMKTIHGRLFRGRIGDDHEVAIKTWEFLFPFKMLYGDHPSRFCTELEILIAEEPHQALMKIQGFCICYTLAIVYNEKLTGSSSLKRLCRGYSSVPWAGENFGWNGRLKVATQLASLFTWLHEKRIAFGSVSTSTIMVDKDFNIKVFDFEHLAHAREEDDTVTTENYLCYNAPENGDGIRTLKSDVYAFGILLGELIADKSELPKVDSWMRLMFEGDLTLIMDKSLSQNDKLARHFSKIVAKCLEYSPSSRPDMKRVYAALSDLEKSVCA